MNNTIDKTKSFDKGNYLEDAVELLERFIIQNNQHLKQLPVTIERKKIIFHNGVKHEIDLYIQFDPGSEYSSIFIFECKNRKEATSKTDILDFIEKIKASGAQKGFFISKNIGIYAKAQAHQDKRVQLIEAKKFSKFEELFNFPLQRLRNTFLLKIGAELRKDKLKPADKPIPILVEAAKVIRNGAELNAKQFFEQLANDCAFETTKDVNTNEFQTGEVREYKGSKEFIFTENELTVDNKPVNYIKIDTIFNLCMVDPRIKSIFDVNTRGRVAQIEYINPGTNLSLVFTYLEIPVFLPIQDSKQVEAKI